MRYSSRNASSRCRKRSRELPPHRPPSCSNATTSQPPWVRATKNIIRSRILTTNESEFRYVIAGIIWLRLSPSPIRMIGSAAKGTPPLPRTNGKEKELWKRISVFARGVPSNFQSIKLINILSSSPRHLARWRMYGTRRWAAPHPCRWSYWNR